MPSRLYDNVLVKRALTIVARTNGTITGDIIDRQQTSPKDNQFNSVTFVVETGTLTDGAHAITILESDDGSSFTDAATADVHGTEPTTVTTNDDVVFEFGYHGNKRFVRLQVVTSGATTGGILGAVAILANGRKPLTR